MPLSLLLLVVASDPVTGMVDTARRLTAADHRCRTDANSTDITVCGLRNADRFRVPFVGYEPGDPRGESVAAERQRLMAPTDSCREKRAIMTGCGFAGVHMTTNDRGTSVTGARKMAP